MAVDEAQTRQIVAAQSAAQDALAAAAVRVAAHAVGSFGSWYDPGAIGAWARSILAMIQGLQRQSAALTDAYLARLASAITGRPVKPTGQIIDIASLRRGADPVAVYGRAADTYRYAVAEGLSAEEAVGRAATRAEVIAETDVSLAMRAQAHRFMVVHRVDGFRRVIHPEASAGKTCGLCVAAAARVYHRDDLLPLHARCRCTVAPILNGIDPGHVLNTADLRRLYKVAGGTQAEHLTSVRFDVHHDGELGPVLVAAGQHFRTAAQAAAAATRAS